MLLSLRRRLIAVSILAVIACAAALLSVWHLSRTSARQRIERTEDRVEREVDRLRELPERGRLPLGPRFARGLVGYLDASFNPTAGSRFVGPAVRDMIDDAARESARTRATVTRTIEQRVPLIVRRRAPDDEAQGVVVVAVGPLPSGGYAWAGAWVTQPRGERLWRLGAMVLALATLALVAVALHTLLALGRGAEQLGATLRSLTDDLAAPVTRPRVAELAKVSDGIASLSQALLRAQDEHTRLSRELAQRERLASLGRVAAGVAHEVRNPMASIKLRIDLARQSVLTPRADLAGVAADLSEAGDEIGRLDRLVADLLVISGRRMGPAADTDLRALVDQRAAFLDHLATAHGLSLAVEGSARAEVDADSLARVVDNLLRNAIEAAPAGSVVRAALSRGDGGVTIAVIDGGAGVPPERVGELFEPFFTTKNEGTGLGLALSRAVAEAHGGSLRYRRVGAATSFELTLPAVARRKDS